MRQTHFVLAALLFLNVTGRLTAGQGNVKRVGEPVKDEYLVFLVDGDRNEVPGLANGLANAHNGKLIKVWNDGVQGFWVNMNAAEAEALLHNPHVRSIEENPVVHESGSEDVQRIGLGANGGNDPFWHLSRIDRRSGTNGPFQYCSGATQVYAYVFDVGVKAIDQLGSRVQGGVNLAPVDPTGNNPDTAPPPYSDGAYFSQLNPCGSHNVLNAGHGTSVATLLAGSDVGVSKTTIVVPLRWTNCSGVNTMGNYAHPLSSGGAWIDAFNWLMGTSNPLWDHDNQRSVVPAVMNFSTYWGVETSTWNSEYYFESLLQTIIRGGVVVVASANNQNQPGHAGTPNYIDDPSGAMAQVPTRLSYSTPYTFFSGPERVITVGGTMLANGVDRIWTCTPDANSSCGNAPGSNWGTGVDIWAPADNIQTGHIALLSPGTGDSWNGPQYRRPFYFGTADGESALPPHPYARSGTSFAAPIVAGAAARLLSEDPSLFSNPSTTAATVWSRLSDSATRLDPVAANLGANSPNLFLYIGGVNFKTQPQSSNFSGGTATLISEAVGTGLSYQLYAGHTGDTTASVGSPQTSGTFTVIPSGTTTYWIRATNTCPADGTTVSGDSSEATVTVTCQGVSITSQPTSNPAVLNQGASATLTIGVTGATPIAVQWYTSAGVFVGTGPSISVSPASTTSYYAVASNSCNTAPPSNPVTVTVRVCEPATLGSAPTASPSTITAGQTSKLTGENAGGTGPLTYLWYKSDGTLVGTRNNNPKFIVSPSVTTSYYYEVSNSCGITGPSATVTVTVQ